MSAPLVWIIIPGLAAVLLFFFRRWQKPMHLAAVIIALGMSWLAWVLPIGEPIHVRFWAEMPALRVAESITFLGMRFILDDALRPLLVILYLSMAFWFGGAFSAFTSSLFIPIGFGMASLLAAALAVNPSNYTILIIELAALLCVPLFSQPGDPIGSGVRRFLSFQITGMGIVLVAAWLLAIASQQGLGSEDIKAGIFSMGLGYALILGIIPFHSWISMTAGETNPYAASFVYYLLPSAIFFTLLDSLIRYTGTPVSTEIYIALRTGGGLMVLGGGLWAAFENHMGRMLGFAAMHQIGMALLLLSLNEFSSPTQPLTGFFFANLLPQGIALALWALSLSQIRHGNESLQLRSLLGLAHRFPVLSITLVLSMFSLAGLPLLASFPVYFPLWSVLVKQAFWLTTFSLIGSIFLFIAGIRSLSVLFSIGTPEPWRISEDRLLIGLLLIGLLALCFMGLFPSSYIPSLAEMARLLTTPFP